SSCPPPAGSSSSGGWLVLDLQSINAQLIIHISGYVDVVNNMDSYIDISKMFVPRGQTLFLVSKTARKNQEQSLTPSPLDARPHPERCPRQEPLGRNRPAAFTLYYKVSGPSALPPRFEPVDPRERDENDLEWSEQGRLLGCLSLSNK